MTRDLSEITVACTPHLDKDQRNRIVRDIENQLRKLDNIYNIDSEDDSLPDVGAFDRLRKLLNKK